MREILLKITNFTESLVEKMKDADLAPIMLAFLSATIVIVVILAPNQTDAKVNGAYNVALALGSGAAGLAAPKGDKKNG